MNTRETFHSSKSSSRQKRCWNALGTKISSLNLQNCIMQLRIMKHTKLIILILQVDYDSDGVEGEGKSVIPRDEQTVANIIAGVNRSMIDSDVFNKYLSGNNDNRTIIEWYINGARSHSSVKHPAELERRSHTDSLVSFARFSNSFQHTGSPTSNNATHNNETFVRNSITAKHNDSNTNQSSITVGKIISTSAAVENITNYITTNHKNTTDKYHMNSPLLTNSTSAPPSKRRTLPSVIKKTLLNKRKNQTISDDDFMEYASLLKLQNASASLKRSILVRRSVIPKEIINKNSDGKENITSGAEAAEENVKSTDIVISSDTEESGYKDTKKSLIDTVISDPSGTEDPEISNDWYDRDALKREDLGGYPIGNADEDELVRGEDFDLPKSFYGHNQNTHQDDEDVGGMTDGKFLFTSEQR